ncbi:unnamed protein product [Cuscuta campestris]|uniref:Reverse transcriptase domain-containing protein n=1 Tax=Cuscuta campestris TaxID=132261 RepID=A0A484NJ76_9ASTE|nr:unnamed protein product [Cuscuta campestris]
MFGTTPQVGLIDEEVFAAGATVPESAHSRLLANVILEEVKDVVFDIGKLLKQIIHAMIVLIPKTVHNPLVKDFRPIACPNGLYKIITEIFWKRIAPLLNDLIDPAQEAFVQGRSLVDNILLSQYLIKDYAIRRSTPSCMIKMDITKAYDTVSWRFIEDAMLAFGFPSRFVSLVMECVTSAFSSIMVNGDSHGLGDLPYVQVLMDCLSISQVSQVLVLNPTKSNIFIAGKYRDTSHEILGLVSFPRGQLPVRYLGLPLASQRLSKDDYAPLFKTLEGFLSKWKTMKISYAGKLELIRAVIQGVQSFWLQAFPV